MVSWLQGESSLAVLDTGHDDSTASTLNIHNLFMQDSLQQPREVKLEPAVLGDNSQFPTDHNKLELLAQQTLKGKDLKRFREDMTVFENRVVSEGLDNAEVAKTYDQITRLLSATGDTPVKQSDKVRIAEQVLHQAAHPRAIDQGQHQTCSVAVVETRTYARTPSAAAKLVADVATTGSFTSADGTTITCDTKSLKADDEARDNPAANRNRSHASQVFQIAAVNVHWERWNFSPTGERVPRGSIKFEQDPDKRGRFDRGERLYDYSQGTPGHPKEAGTQPRLGVSDLTDISNQITGLKESGFVIEHKKRGGPNTIQVDSEDSFKQAVLDARDGKQFPIIVRVHTGNDPFTADSRGSGVWHAVTIVGIDEAKGKVLIDNQWGTGSDQWVKWSTLYRATLQPDDKTSMAPRDDKVAILHDR